MSGFRTIASSHGIKGLHIILIGILLFTFYCVPSSADVAASPTMYNCLGEVGKLNTCAFNCWIENNGETSCEYWVNTCKAKCAQSSSSTKSPPSDNTPTSALLVSIQTNANSYTVGDPYTVSVLVEDSSTDTPVSGASLSITYFNQNTGQKVMESGTTNSAGKYSQTGSWSEGAIGTITITATATKASYTSRSASTTITVSSGQTAPDILQASFSANPYSGNSPLTVQFSDRSTGYPNKWKWEFGDGATSTSQNPVHIYNALEDILGSADYFTVTLTIWNTQSSDVATKVNYIIVYPGSYPIQNSGSTVLPVTPIIPIEPPVASFTTFPSSGTAPLRVSFSDTSTGTVSSHLWDFGDGYKSELTNPSHTFKEAGTYTIRLTVSGAGGTDAARKTITVTAQTDDSAKNGGGESSEGEDEKISVDPIPPINGNDSLTPEDIGAGAVAGIVGVTGALIAIGAAGLPGSNISSRTIHKIQSDTEFLIEEMKKRITMTNDPWREQTEDLITQQLSFLKKEGYYVRNKTYLGKAWNNLVGNFLGFGIGLDNVTGYIGGQCEEWSAWGTRLYKSNFDTSRYSKIEGPDELYKTTIDKKLLAADIRKGEIIGTIDLKKNFFSSHTATLVVRPNGERFVIDYWESMIDGKPKIYPEKVWLKKWSEILGIEDDYRDLAGSEFSKKYITNLADLKSEVKFNDLIKNHLEKNPLHETPFYELNSSIRGSEESLTKFLNSEPIREYLVKADNKDLAMARVLSFWRDPWPVN